MIKNSLKKASSFLICFFLIASLASCEKPNTILTNVAEDDANQIIVLLQSKGISATKTPVKSSGAGATQSTESFFNVTVDSSRSTEALAILNRIGLPRKPGLTLLDLFPQQGMMKTDKEEQIRYNAGLNEQLANTIRQIDGILAVEVQVAFPVQDTFNPDAQKESPVASVFIKHDGILDDPNNLLVQKIRRYVSGSILDLTYENVTVVADRARFTDINLSSLEPKTEATPWGTQDYVKIWSIVVAQQSASSFRTILFLFSIFLLILIAALVWIVWKFQKAFKKINGYKDFFKPEPIEFEKKEGSSEEEASEKSAEEGEGE